MVLCHTNNCVGLFQKLRRALEGHGDKRDGGGAKSLGFIEKKKKLNLFSLRVKSLTWGELLVQEIPWRGVCWNKTKVLVNKCGNSEAQRGGDGMGAQERPGNAPRAPQGWHLQLCQHRPQITEFIWVFYLISLI